MSRGIKNSWVLLICLLAGLVLGGFLGRLCAGTQALGWLNYGQSFGLTAPAVLDLGIIAITFAFTIHITIAGIIGMLIGYLIYRIL